MRLLTRYYMQTLPALVFLAGILAWHAWMGYQKDLEFTCQRIAAANQQTTNLLAQSPVFQIFMDYRRLGPLDAALKSHRQKARENVSQIVKRAQGQKLPLTYIALLDHNLDTVVTYGIAEPGDESEDSLRQKMEKAASPTIALYQKPQVTTAPIFIDRDNDGSMSPAEMLGYIRIDYQLPWEAIQASHISSLENHFQIIAVSLIVLTFLLSLAGRSVLEPIETMVAQAEDCAAGNLGQNFQLSRGPKEMKKLAKSLRKMMTTLGNQRAELLESRNTLRAQLEFQQTMIDTVTVPIYYKDTEGHYSGCNQALIDLTGVPREELLGKTSFDIFEQELAERYHQADQELIAAGGQQQYESKVRNASGELRDVIFHKVVFNDSDGRVQGIIGAFIDITDIRVSEKALSEQKELLQAILNNLPSHVYWKDRNSVYLGGNQAFAEFAGLESPQDLVGQTLEQFPLSEKDRSRVLETDRKLIATGRPSTNEEYRLPIRGEYRTFLIKKVPLKNEHGETIGLLGINTDISERIEAEQKSHQQEALLRQILNNLPADIYWKDCNLIYQGGNRRFASTFGVESPEELIGRPLDDLPYPESVIERLRETDEQVIQSGDPILDLEIRVPPQDGLEAQILRINKVPLTDPLGQVTGVLGVNTDITHLRNTTEELRQKQEMLQILLDSLPVAVYWKDCRLIYQGCNRRFAKTLGLEDPHELIGRGQASLPYPAEILEELTQMDNQVVKEGSPIFDREIDLPTPKGMRTVLLSKVPLKGPEGQIIGILGISSDISQRKLAEQELARQESLLRNILENLPSMLFVKEADSLTYVEVNRAGEELMGFTREELIGRDDFSFFPDQAAFFQRKDRETLSGRKAVDIPEELIDTRKIGQRWLHTRKIPLMDEKGEPAYLLGISEDITEKKRTAEELQEKTLALQQLLDNLPVAVYWKDCESRYLASNQYFNDLHNLGPSDMVQGLPLESLPYPPEILQSVREEDQQVLATGASVTAEAFWPVHGEVRAFLIQKVPVRDDDGNLIGLMGIDTDITERKEAEEALQEAHDQLEQRVEERTTDLKDALARLQEEVEIRKRTEEALQASEARFRNLYNHTPVLMLALAHNGAVISVNDYLLETLGYSRAEILGEDYHLLLAEGFNAPGRGLWQALQGTSQVQDLPIRVQTKAGKDLDVLVTATVDRSVPENQQRLIVAMVDITERLRAEYRLLDTLEQLEEVHHIVNNSPAVAFLWKAKEGWPVEYVSENISQFGYTASELQESSLQYMNMIHLEDRSRICSEAARYLKSGCNQFRQTYRLRQKNGEYRWMDDRTWVRRNEDGTPTHFQALVLDIHEQRLAEQQLRETLARLEDLENIVNKSPAVAFLCRAEEGWPVDFVSSNIRQFGYQEDDFLEGGLPYTALVHPDDLPHIESEMARWSSQDDPQELLQSYRLVKPDGQICWINDWNWVRRNNKGQVTHYQGLILDVTEQRQAENELRQVLEDQSRLFQHANSPIMSTDKNCLVTEWNDCAQIMSGYSREEVLGQNFLNGCLNKREVFRAIKQVLAGEVVSNLEVTMVNKEGDRIEILLSLTARRNDAGNVVGVVGMGQDITTRKHAEQTLQQARDRAEEANRAKSNFLATMSHEIRTPMNAIIGMTQMARQTQLDPLQEEYLDAINDSTQQLLHLVNDILDFSKIEAGQLELEMTSFHLGNILRNLARTQGLRAWQKGLFLDLNIDNSLNESYLGDPGRIQQVLVNLTENALKFTDHLGITVNVGKTNARFARKKGMPLKENPKSQLLEFSVTDTGIGIAADRQKEIFERFRQSDSSTTRKYGGTGLGLAICKELVQRMGGVIWVESVPGEGSSFRFILPLEPAKQTKPRLSRSKAAKKTKGSRLLLAEDNPMNLKVARHFLEKMGYDLILAENGQQVLESLQQTPVDLVLMDIEMPVLDGLEATRRIRDGQCGDQRREIPIIALTAHAFEGYREHCLAAGMDDFLTKPLDFDHLSELIQHWLSLDRRFCQVPKVQSLDRKKALQKMEGDALLLDEINTLFLEELPKTTGRLEKAMKAKDCKKLQLLAHGLKAPAAMIGAEKAFSLAQKLEKCAESGTLDRCKELLEDLLAELTEVAQHLEKDATPA